MLLSAVLSVRSLRGLGIRGCAVEKTAGHGYGYMCHANVSASEVSAQFEERTCHT